MKLEIHNFLCYKDITVDFSEFDRTKPILVMSDSTNKSNGVGKSALFQSLLWLYWGQIPRLKNTKIQNLESDDKTVKVRLETEQKVLERVRSTAGHLVSTLDITDKQSGEQLHFDTLSSSVEYISNYFGRIDLDTFSFLYYFDTYSFVSFFALSNGRKKELLERLFKIDVFQELLEKVKFSYEGLKSAKAELLNEISSLLRENELITQQVATLNQNAKHLTESQQEIEKIKQRIVNIDKEISIMNTKEVEKLKEYSTKMIEFKTKYNYYQKQLKSLPKIGEPCPVCGTTISDNSHIAKHKKELLQKVESIKSRYTKLKQKVAKLEPIKEKYNQLLQKKKQLETGINTLQSHIQALSDYKSQIQTLQETIDKNNKEIEQKQNRIQEIEEELIIYEFWLKGFSDKGVKAYFFESFLIQLENILNIYIKKFFNFEIKLKVTETIIDIQLPNGAGYEYLSTGQRKKIDLAFNFAIRQLIPTVYNDWVVYDEVFDGLDKDGILKVINILSEINQDRYVFIITHNSDLKEYFTQFLMISNNRTIKIVKE